MDYLSYGLVSLLFLWVGLSPLIWLYWNFKPDRRGCAPTKFVGVVAVGAFIAVGMLLTAGFKSTLFFIPEDFFGMPRYENLRDWLASLLGMASAAGIFALMEKKIKLQRENRELNQKLKKYIQGNPDQP